MSNATAYGHLDILDAGIASDVGEVGHNEQTVLSKNSYNVFQLFGICADNHFEDDVDDLYRNYIVGQVVSLFKGILAMCV